MMCNENKKISLRLKIIQPRLEMSSQVSDSYPLQAKLWLENLKFSIEVLSSETGFLVSWWFYQVVMIAGHAMLWQTVTHLSWL